MLGTAVCLIVIDPYWKWPMCHKNNRDVEIFLDMPVISTDFENPVSRNNKICSRNINILSVRMKFCQSNSSVWHFDITEIIGLHWWRQSINKTLNLSMYKMYLTQKSISLKICIPSRRNFLWASNFVIGTSLFFKFLQMQFFVNLKHISNLLNKCWRQPETFKNLECMFQMYLVINSNTLSNMFARQQRLSLSSSCWCRVSWQ